MEYRDFGRTGVKVSALALGCMMFGRRTEAKDSYAIIDRALDAGVNMLDTANVYGRGRSEEVTGQALKRNGKRSSVFLATKVHQAMADDDPNAQGNSRRHILEQCEASLRRLQTDYIDLYQLHRPDRHIPIDETLRALDDLVRSGRVRYIGTSNFGAWQIVEALWASKELGLNRFVSDQSPYNLADRRMEREHIPMAMTFGIAITPWSPIGGGLLTGKYRRGEPEPEGSRYALETDPSRRRRFSPGMFDLVDRLEPVARRKGVPLSQFALAWVRRQPGVTAPIIGPRTMEQLEDNLRSLDVEITDEDRRRVDEAIAPGEHVAPFFEASFAPNIHRVVL
ncbi:MAG: aldo/keto reductase [Gemmatimonadetes bacterium]|nr:aldo/keto reductase [Gemmatimonadota bacterium]